MHPPHARPEPRLLTDSRPTTLVDQVEVARAGDLPPGTTLLVNAAGGPILLANVEGSIYAVSAICTHKRLPLEGARLDGCRLICPWHFTEFDVRTGEQVKWAYGGPLRTFPVKRVGESLFVDVPSA